MKQKLLTLLCAVLFGINLFATDYEIGTGGTTSSSANMPIAFSSMTYNSISQQLYFASELTEAGASAGSITAISFYYMSSTAKSRTCEVWINEVTKTYLASSEGSDQWMYGVSSSNPAPGTKVFDGTVSIPASSGWYTIILNSSFAWGGTKNIVITINDRTDTRSNMSALNHKVYTTSKSTKPCGIYNTAGSGSSFNAGNAFNLKGTAVKSAPVIKFTFEAASIPAPTSPTATDITHSSATLGWTAAAGADSYEVRFGTTSGSLGDATNVGNVTEYNLTGLEASTKYYYQIRTKIGSAYSAWTDEANFTTTAHIHDAITCEKWTWTNILPTAAGNYYLTNDVTLSSNWEPLGSINLCLNGHRVFFGSNYGIIDDGQTIAIHDYDGNGYMMSSNYTQTLLVSGASTNVFVDRDELILNNAGGRKIVVAENGFASIIYPLTFDDDADNTVHFNEYAGLHITVQLNRAFLTGSCNTICLPFEVSSAILDYIFGVNHVLRLDNSEYYPATQELSLNFVNASTLQAGVPYLIQPTQDCSNPEISGVISVNAPSSIETDFIDFNGVLTPTVLEQGNHNLLCVGAGNELFWPNTSNAMKSFRAYFEVKGAARNAVRARIVKGEQSTEDINSIQDNSGKACKRIIDGQFLIEKNGILYNAQGARIQ